MREVDGVDGAWLRTERAVVNAILRGVRVIDPLGRLDAVGQDVWIDGGKILAIYHHIDADGRAGRRPDARRRRRAVRALPGVHRPARSSASAGRRRGGDAAERLARGCSRRVHARRRDGQHDTADRHTGACCRSPRHGREPAGVDPAGCGADSRSRGRRAGRHQDVASRPVPSRSATTVATRCRRGSSRSRLPRRDTSTGRCSCIPRTRR